MDVGKWLARQRKPEVWATLAEGQRERLEAVGVTPLPVTVLPEVPTRAPVEPGVPTGSSTAPVSAFERGVARPWRSTRPARAL
ncbi:helicase associated domain-containing protein [Streptomyces sp. NPDC055663]